MDEKLLPVLEHYTLPGLIRSATPYGNGHINDTYLLTVSLENGVEEKYILQKINKHVFRQPEQLMENIVRVTAHLREKVLAAKGNPKREVLNLLATKTGTFFMKDPWGEYWRIYDFIHQAISFEQVRHGKDFYESGFAFGHFHSQLMDFPAKTLHETIPLFHHTPTRFRRFEKAVGSDPCKQVEKAKKEILFLQKRQNISSFFQDEYAAGRLTLRVTHNDTKLNNVMIDPKSGKGVCAIDLDTVMPGFVAHDFGDAIRKCLTLFDRFSRRGCLLQNP